MYDDVFWYYDGDDDGDIRPVTPATTSYPNYHNYGVWLERSALPLVASAPWFPINNIALHVSIVESEDLNITHFYFSRILSASLNARVIQQTPGIMVGRGGWPRAISVDITIRL